MGATNVQASESKPATSLGANDVAVAAEDASVDASVDALWVRKWDDASNSLFYFNLRTQESSWEQPEAYKAVFMSEPLDLDSEKQCGASVTIQSLYRGRKDRERVKEAKKWTQQFDPATAQKYYYNSETGESQWEKPMDLLTGVKDERSARAVKIQSVFRAKKARDRVKQLADEEEEEEQLEQQLQEETPCSRPLWSEYFDPRSGKYYYRHATTGAIIWEKPEDFVSSKAEGSKRDVAALSIQCAARKRIAANNLAAKREKLRVLTDLSTMQLKLGELKQVSLEIQMEIEARALVSTEEEKRFPHLASLVLGWRESLESIKNHVASLENRGDDILLAECLAARVVHAERFHKALAEMRSECLALLRSILLMNSYFVDLDVSRINVACTTFAKWKAHEVCALRDSRMLEIVQGSEISQLLEQAEALLRRSMGLTDFNNGFTSTTGKRYEDWHPSVTAALVGVQEMEERLTRKIQLLRGFRAAEARKREVSQMAEEDLLACRLAQQRRRRLNDKVDYATFLVKCQECWQKGLNQREEDLYAIAAGGSAKMQQQMQKARRLGYDFMVRTARSDHGETLIQIACWWGHEHLVKFFLEEGARIDSIDSTCNRFSLLHDAARRGHSRVIRILLENGLACNVADSAGDTPLHWAARKNNFSAVVTLLGVYLAERDKALADEILKAVRHKNLRGKTAYALAKGDRVRTVFSQRLQPPALQRLSVAATDILKDAAALASMRGEIPSMDSIRVTKQQKPTFGRILKFLHLHEPTGYERDEEHKRTAISSIQEVCLGKVLRWFEASEANSFASATASTPILPPRM
uniref:WW domain-containing protein n=1 Tax=Phytophthora ramorum TaxID=164328 RepID=H3HDU1_PHYRM